MKCDAATNFYHFSWRCVQQIIGKDKAISLSHSASAAA
jgi:hypothetical protein